MFNRVKLLVLAIILAIFTILFFQNQEPLSLKLFCSDTTSQYCFYQTPSISLAIWMVIFIGLGIFSGLVWQVLKGAANSTTRESKSSSGYSRTPQTRTSYREQSSLREETDFRTSNRIASDSTNFNNARMSDWEQRRSEDWEQANVTNFAQDDKSLRSPSDNRPSEPKYADKFAKERELDLRKPSLGARSLDEETSSGSHRWESEIRRGRDSSGRATPSDRASQAQVQASKESSNSEDSQPKSPGSQKTEEVYDASYRTLNNVPPPSIPEDTVIEDEDPDWI